MLEFAFVLAIAIGLVNLLKKWLPSAAYPWVAFVLVIVLNMLNASVFGDGVTREIVQDTLVQGAIALGIVAGTGYVDGKLISKD